MGDPSFITWRLAEGQVPLDPRERDLVASVLRRGDGSRYTLLAFVVMDDHVHALAHAGCWAPDRMAGSWRTSTEQQLRRIHGRRGEIWAAHHLAQPVRTAQRRRDVELSIVGNPWKRWPFLQGYRWMWIREE
jgi:REP element-mobilizing transposase RayT